jgi:hypothetical protein
MLLISFLLHSDTVNSMTFLAYLGTLSMNITLEMPLYPKYVNIKFHFEVAMKRKLSVGVVSSERNLVG